ADELEKDLKYDPIDRLAAKLIEAGYTTETELDAIKEEIKRQVEADTRWVMEQDKPTAEEGTSHVLCETPPALVYDQYEPAGEPIVMVDAINHALAEEMARD
ncbi:thiamine pyrophosphate-dependent enzyme, partial [Arthrospira platensis SPKY1]|nr:thiamine pyrophosphate-dependent enzyme [Arthrospira platensis SPKY1]